MESFIENLLMKRGYTVNHNAQSVIRMCDNWYANRIIEDFHRRRTIQGTPYELNRLNFAKRCCSDDAKLCEVLEVNAGAGEQAQRVNDILAKNEFEVQYRKQLEKHQQLVLLLAILGWTMQEYIVMERFKRGERYG